MKTLAATLAFAAILPLLSACGERNTPQPDPSASAGKPQPETAIGRSVEKAMDKARAKLATENISLTNLRVSDNGKGISINTDDNADDGRPKAHITPQGDLLIEGRKVEANAEQHALLVKYREQIEGVASAGMDIGVAGADLGIKAATQAIASVFSGGDPGEVEKRVESEAESIKLAARKLCGLLPGMLDTQTKLAAAMPEFKPYATMDQGDIDDCYNDDDLDAHERQQVQARTRDEIRNTIRRSIQTVAQGAGVASSGTHDDNGDVAAEAEAASAEAAERR